MKKWVCTVCGYVYEGEAAPEICPVMFMRVRLLRRSARFVRHRLPSSKSRRAR